MSGIRYDNGEDVNLGDFVSYQSSLLWWRWKPGRLSYLPGTSTIHPEMEHDGLKWVGVSGVDGTFRGVLIEPDTQRVRKGVRFVGRCDGTTYLTPDQIPEDEW
ncbi:MAG: hypothetical protein KDA57_21285 [Planctomycetales bacterium]|nr:hypothetical protein [Planctomycetales bacterium]